MTDVWNGTPLTRRTPVGNQLSEQIHYRLYDQRSHRLLSFNSTNTLESIVADVANTAREHPNARIAITRFDGPT